MRRLSMKSKKGKAAETSDSENAHQDEIEDQGNGESNAGGSEGESASEDVKVNTKRKNKRGRKKVNSNADGEDGATDSKKRKKDEDREEPEEYEVDTIVDMKQARGKRQFKIRWKGYGAESDSWENEDDLSCPEIIKNYLEQAENKDDNKSKKRGGKSSKTPKKKARGEATDSDAEESSEGGGDTKEYEVDKVMEVHFKKNGSREFLIHWKGFSHKDDTWEPEKNLSCPDLIEKFMAKVDKAKSAGSRELRANPQHTDRFTLNMRQSGRRLSRRNQGKQRATYHDAE